MSDFQLPTASVKKTSKTPAIRKTGSLLDDLTGGSTDSTKPEQGDLAREDEPADKPADDKPKYSPEELAALFDEIIFNGEYTEDVVIRDRLKVRFRTRSAGEIDEIERVVDSTQATLIATLQQKRQVLNVQYALVSYQGKDLSTLSIADRAKFLSKVPGPVVGALMLALSKFDEKVFMACKDAEENF